MFRRFWKSIGAVCAVCLIAGLLASTHVSAQDITADLVGTVTDSTGAVVPNAKITVRNTGTAETRIVISGSSGEYSVNQLQPGTYSINVDATGFKASQIPSIALSAGSRVREDAQMQIGAQTQTVQVTSATPALQTDSSSLTATLTEPFGAGTCL